MPRVTKLLFFLAIAVYTISACGITTHNVISNTAFEKLSGDSTVNYKDIIRNNRNYFQSGSAFPDWGYGCPLGDFNATFGDILSNASETAHWIPFMKAAVKYLNTTYQRPWNTDAQRLLAFLLGVASHSVADILWHDIGIIGVTRQGFIQAMCESDFNCRGQSYNSDVHGTADTGGEFVNAKFYDLSFIQQDWVLPYDDLLNIYKSMGIELTHFDMMFCFARLGIEIDFVSDINPDIIYPFFAKQSNFLVNSMHDWWLGGIQSMAFWSQNCWTGIMEYLDTGNVSSICALYRDSLTYNLSSQRAKAYEWKRAFMRTVVDNKVYSTEKTKNQIRTHLADMQCVTNYTSKFDSPFEGSMFSYSFDVSDDHILIGAPFDNQNQGSVSLISLNQTKDSTNKRINGTRENKNDDLRFGANVKFIDINNDKTHDVIINEPGHRNFMGRTHIFLNVNDTVDFNSSNAIIIEHIGDSWGSSVHLSNGDFNGDGVDDLLMGFSQFRSGGNLEIGAIIVVLGSADWKSGDYVLCDNTQCNSSLVIVKSVGSVFWEQAGSAIKVIQFEGSSYVLVSSPTFNLGQGSIGRVACWDLASDKLLWEVHGQFVNSGFGTSLESDDTFVYIGAPFTDAPRVAAYMGGSVYVYRLADLFNGKMDPETAIYGSDSYSRFGQSLAINNGKLYISAPFTKDIRGFIFAYNAQEFKPSGCYTVGEKSHTALGYKLIVKNGVMYAGAPHQDNFRGGLYTFSV